MIVSALRAGAAYITSSRAQPFPQDQTMRAETQSVIDEIKQSLGLLRRHL
jgi:hypothetical protein